MWFCKRCSRATWKQDLGGGEEEELPHGCSSPLPPQHLLELSQTPLALSAKRDAQLDFAQRQGGPGGVTGEWSKTHLGKVQPPAPSCCSRSVGPLLPCLPDTRLPVLPPPPAFACDLSVHAWDLAPSAGIQSQLLALRRGAGGRGIPSQEVGFQRGLDPLHGSEVNPWLLASHGTVGVHLRACCPRSSTWCASARRSGFWIRHISRLLQEQAAAGGLFLGVLHWVGGGQASWWSLWPRRGADAWAEGGGPCKGLALVFSPPLWF